MISVKRKVIEGQVQLIGSLMKKNKRFGHLIDGTLPPYSVTFLGEPLPVSDLLLKVNW